MATKDPYEQVKEIYRLKGIYDGYLKSGDTANMEKTKNEAQPYYQQLINNGYANVADDLSKSNYTNAKSIYDKYVSSVKPQANVPSVPSSQNSLNQEQINNLLSTGTTTGTGTQKSLNDNSFWNQYNQYVDQNRSKADEIFGMIAGNNDAAGQTTTNRVNDLWGTITGDKANLTADYDKLKDFNYSNPFETETGKSVLERYDLAALQGRDNQAALGGANNSGNIDSYSAANALRQQASLRNLGEQSALAAHDRTVNSGRGILSDQSNYYSDLYNRLTGLIDTEANAASSRNQDLLQLIKQGYTDPTQQYYENGDATLSRLYNQGETSRLNDLYIDETKQNNALQREIDTSNMIGNISQERNAQKYGYVDQNGNLINANMDYHAKILELKQRLNTTTDSQKQKEIEANIAALEYARNLKTQQSEYAKYANDYAYGGYSPAATASVSQSNAQISLDKYLADMGLLGTLGTSAYNLAGIQNTNASNVEMNKYNTDSQERMHQIEAELKKMGYNNEQTSMILNYMLGLDTNSTNRQNTATQANAQTNVAGINAASSNYAVDKNYDLGMADINYKKNLEPDYKPSISTSEMERQISAGFDTAELRDAVKYYTGKELQAYRDEKFVETTYNSLSASGKAYFLSIKDKGMDEPELKKDMIQQLEAEKIKPEDAISILEAFGYPNYWVVAKYIDY